jgi:predicted RNA binding protein YcfA (HicA-like mRNA interferase family)
MHGICSGKPIKFILSAVFPPIFFLFSNTLHAQSLQQDSIFYQTALTNTIAIYYKQLGDQSQLFNGSHYASTGYNFRTGSAYFLSDSFSNGSLVYDGILFDSLSLLYEDLRQLLVAKRESYLLQFINQRISSFIISGHHFIRLAADSTNKGLDRTGFYEILYTGSHIQMLKETTKNITEVPSAYEGILRYINVSNGYYFKKDNVYVQISSKKELFDFFGARQKDIQRFIKKSRLNFRKDKENTLIQAAGFFDQISK